MNKPLQFNQLLGNAMMNRYEELINFLACSFPTCLWNSRQCVELEAQ